ncbi:MAG: tetratricopeptide repeat protein [Vicinamibacteria bacterium]|nr:tetratricopeptide repeat protein [Vicinamibacteria bacterium]
MNHLGRCGAFLFCAVLVASGVAAQAPEGPAERLKKGQEALQQNRFDTALEHFERVLQVEPDNAAALCGKGQALARTGRGPEARGYYQQALAAQPDFRAARVGLAWLDLWNDTPRALEALRDLHASEPDDVQLGYLEKAARRQLGPRASLGFGAAQDNQDLGRQGLQLEAAGALRNGNLLGFKATHASAEYEGGVDDVAVNSFEASSVMAAGAGRRIDLRAGFDQIENVNGDTHSKPTGAARFLFGLGRRFGGSIGVDHENLNYGPVQIEDEIEATRFAARFEAEFGPQLLFDVAGGHWAVTSESGDVTRNEFAAGLARRFQLTRGMPLVVGYNFSWMDNDKDLRNGFWAPANYTRHAAAVRTGAWLPSGIGFNVSAEMGWATYDDQGGRVVVTTTNQPALSLSALFSVPLGKESGLRLDLLAQRSDSGIGSVSGYVSNSFGFRLGWRGTRSVY